MCLFRDVERVTQEPLLLSLLPPARQVRWDAGLEQSMPEHTRHVIPYERRHAALNPLTWQALREAFPGAELAPGVPISPSVGRVPKLHNLHYFAAHQEWAAFWRDMEEHIVDRPRLDALPIFHLGRVVEGLHRFLHWELTWWDLRAERG